MSNQVERLNTIIKSFVISEKSTIAREVGRVLITVAKDANKHEIAAAAKLAFGLDVASVRTILVKGKAKNRGNRKGSRSDFKKAYITFVAGQEMSDLAMEQ